MSRRQPIQCMPAPLHGLREIQALSHFRLSPFFDMIAYLFSVAGLPSERQMEPPPPHHHHHQHHLPGKIAEGPPASICNCQNGPRSGRNAGSRSGSRRGCGGGMRNAQEQFCHMRLEISKVFCGEKEKVFLINLVALKSKRGS